MADDSRPSDSPPPRSPQGAPEDLLSAEELKELLSPLPLVGDEDRDPVLLVTDRPEDGEALAEFLGPRGIRVVPTRDRYAALDLYRRRPYSAVVCDASVLGEDPSRFLARLREVDRSVQLMFLLTAGEEAPLAGLPAVSRPLEPVALDAFFAPLGLPEATEEAPEIAATVDDAGGVSPDPFLGIEAWLDARGEIEPALLAWASRDPALEAVVSFERDGTAWTCRVKAGDVAARGAALRAAGEVLEELDAWRGDSVFALGELYVFEDPQKQGHWWGVYGPGLSPGSLERLAPLVAKLGVSEAPAWRERFVELLRQRLEVARLRGGRAGLLVLETPGFPGDTLETTLRELLRDGDWVERHRGRVFAILAPISSGTLVSVGRRLRASDGGEHLRLVAGSVPSGDDAERLLAQLEARLDETDLVPLVDIIDP